MQSSPVTSAGAAGQFPADWWEARLFERLSALLSRILRPGEAVRMMVESGPPQEGVGALFTSSRHSILVLTDTRLLCVPVAADLVPLESVSEVAWGDVAATSTSSTMRNLSIVYRSGRKESIAITVRRDVARLRGFLATIGGEPTPDLERRYLCPDCGRRIPEAVDRCANCGLPFRSTRNAVRFALWYPGGGYFFLRNTSLGVLGVAVELFVLIAARFVYKVSALGRIEHPALAYVALLLVWMAWKIATARHVAATAREPIADRNAEKRESQIPTAIAKSVVETTVAAGAAATAAIGAAGREAVSEALEMATAEARDVANKLRADDFDRPQETIDSATRERLLAPHSWNGVPFAWGYLLRQVMPAARGELQAEQMQSVEKIRAALIRLLDPGEVVVYVTRGATPFSIADYLGPMLFLYFIRRCFYVFTDRRMIVLPVTPNDEPLPNVSVVPYGDITGYRFTAGYAAGFMMNFKIRLAYANGRNETFNRFPFEDFQRLQRLLPRFIALAPPNTGKPRLTALRQRLHLCPFCGSLLRRNVFRCFTCAATYRRKKTAAWLAALVPGAGFFYTGKPRLGILDAALQTFLIANLAGIAIAVAGGSSTQYRTALLVYVALLLVNKVVSIYQAVELAGEYIVAEPPPRALEPRIAPPADEQAWIVTTLIVTAGVIVIVTGLGVRLPLYAEQWELSHLASTIDPAHVKKAEKHMKDLVTRLERLELDMASFERYCSWKSHRISYDPELQVRVLEFTDDPGLDRQYQEALAEYRRLYREYREVAPQYSREASEYNKNVRRIRQLEDDIGDAWTSVDPQDVARDLLRRIGKPRE